MNRSALSLIIGSLLLPLGCGGTDDPGGNDGPTGPAVRLEPGEFCSDHSGAAIATFEDANLEARVRGALSVGAEKDLTCGLLSRLTALDAFMAEVTSLVGIQNLTRLTDYLFLDENSISDISPLSGLRSLLDLNLGYNSITDISALSGLTNMLFLQLDANSITDLSALSGPRRLRGLSVSGNSVSDISVLSSLTSLTFINLTGSSISDINALSGLTNMIQLHLGFNTITDISALSGFASLRFLSLNDNPNLTDIKPLLDNTGFGAGVSVSLRNTSVSCTDVAALQAKGVSVGSDCP